MAQYTLGSTYTQEPRFTTAEDTVAKSEIAAEHEPVPAEPYVTTPCELEQSKVADKVPETPDTLMMTGHSLRSEIYSSSGSSGDSDLIAAENGEKQRQPVLYEHEWQHSVYEGRKLPDDYRQKVRLRGFGGRHGDPWLITNVTGQNDRGEAFDWHARRHRKQRTPHHKIKEHKRFNPFAWLNAGMFTDSPKHFISYLSPLLTMLGSTLFAINNASQISKHVQPWGMYPYHHHLYDWIAGLLAFIGLWVVWPGTYLKLVETMNTDYDMRVHNWEQQGKKGNKPRLRWAGFRPRQLSYWGVVFRVLGAAAFVWAATDNFLNQVCHVYMIRYPVQIAIIYFPYVLAPALFVIGSTFLIWENSHSLYRGFVPFTKKEFLSLGFWVNALGFWGSTGLLVGGICQWNLAKIMMRSGVRGVQLYRGIAYFGFGSLLLDTSQLLILFELSNPDTFN